MSRPAAGIYAIRNRVSGTAYYGSSDHLARRWTNHRSSLRGGYHANARLQSSWLRHGESAFVFEVLALLEPSEVLSTEQRLLDREIGRRGCCNMALVAGAPMAGRKHSAEALEKIAAAGRGKSPGPETRAKMSAWQKARPRPEGWRGSQKGKKLSESHRLALAEAAKRRTFSAEELARRQAVLRKTLSDPVVRDKITHALKGRPFAPEHRAKAIAGIRAYHAARRQNKLNQIMSAVIGHIYWPTAVAA